MPHSDKNIVVSPAVGSSTADPKIVFSAANANVSAQAITLVAYPMGNGTLSFEGSAGQLFSISNNLTGTLFSVNDISGIPSIEVLDTGLVKLAEFGGNVVVGSATDNAAGRLQVNGAITATIFNSTVASGTAPFVVVSNTVVPNLNADLLDGQHGAFYQNATNINAGTLGSAYLPTTITQATTFSANVSVTGQIIANTGSVTAPSITFVGSPTTGFYDTVNSIMVVTSGTARFQFVSNSMRANSSSGPQINGSASSATNPMFIPHRADLSTGIGGLQGELSFIANSTEIVKIVPTAVTINRATTVNDTLTATTFNGSGAGLTNIPWANITGTPTTVSGYGITDAVTIAGVQTITGTKTFGDVTISNLTVTGTTTTVNSVDLNVADSIITLASGNSSGSAPYIGLKAERGTADAFFVWDEGNDRWYSLTSSDDLAGRTAAPIAASQFHSLVSTGVAPFTVASTTLVANLNADLLDGQEGSFYQNATNMNAGTLNDARLPTTMSAKTFSGQITSTVSTGTAPFVVASTTLVANLNADLLDGQHGAYYTNAANMTGVITPPQGGTGISSYTAGNYVRAQSSTALEQRTPDQVRADISATKTTMADSPPSSPNPGDRWIDTTIGTEYAWYNDGDSQQWVEVGQSSSTGSSVAVFIQDTQPNLSTPYLWIQTNLDEDGGFTIWFNQ